MHVLYLISQKENLNSKQNFSSGLMDKIADYKKNVYFGFEKTLPPAGQTLKGWAF